MSRIAGAFLFALLLVACQQVHQMSSNGTESQLQPAVSPSQQASGKGGLLTGRLGISEVEGGCPYLQAADSTRYEVIYPNGWQLDRATLELRDIEGRVVAEAGDTITVRGEIATGMVSTCQIGPIFQATEVVSVE